MRWLTDRCLICGRFVGRYPVGFYCDTHCASCECRHCTPPPPTVHVLARLHEHAGERP